MYNERGGYCYCGCGQKTKPTETNSIKLGFKKGEPARFLNGHQNRLKNHPAWKGGSGIRKDGYKWVSGGGKGKNNEHRVIIENLLGKRLPPGACIHHADFNRSNNSHSNLVVCQDVTYHRLLHRRTKALLHCGHANWLKCSICGEYDSPENVYVHGDQFYHTKCKYEYNRNLRLRKAAAKELT
jgi:hypothetical protein